MVAFQPKEVCAVPVTTKARLRHPLVLWRAVLLAGMAYGILRSLIRSSLRKDSFMSIRTSHRHTLAACYLGYITQAVVNNFAPLLFITFSTDYDIPLSQMAMLVAVNFGVQIIVDLIAARYVSVWGYRPATVAAHIFAALGLVGLGLFPRILPTPFAGILIAIVLYAVGGGLTEVLISPIAEACPTENKEAQMSLLHSFYCWGHVAVIVLSTLYFHLIGTEHWWILACLWAVIPLFNVFLFAAVPIRMLEEDVPEGEVLSLRGLLKKPLFWLLVVMMICAGAGEQAMSQWASAFAEAGLGVSKTVGDLAGPCMFALLMGLSRFLSAKLTKRFSMTAIMAVSCALCCLCYVTAALSSSPFLSLIGCGLCGFSVGIFWPGTLSLSAATLRGGGTAMFALLALAGDLGCVGGPAVVSLCTETLAGGSLKGGMLFGVIFPVGLTAGLILLSVHQKKKKSSS